MKYGVASVVLCLITFATAGTAHFGPAQPRAEVARVTSLLNCQKLPDAAARLRCFDLTSSALSRAIASGEITIVDRAKIRSARRSLFGLPIPDLGIGDKQDDVNQIEGSVAFVSRNRDGGYVIGLTDGSQWSQIDDRPIAIEPQRSDKIVVRRAAMGSFMLSVGRMPAIRVKRVQ